MLLKEAGQFSPIFIFSWISFLIRTYHAVAQLPELAHSKEWCGRGTTSPTGEVRARPPIISMLIYVRVK